MPWMITKRNGKFLVHKQGADNQPEGDTLGTHDNEADAKRQLAALYASENAKAVKFVEGTDDQIEGPGMPYGGPFNGRDLDGQYFSPRTDFVFDWFAEGARPALYHHGLDEDAGTTVVGRVKSWQVKSDIGIWTRAQLDKSSKYFAAIKELVGKGKLYFSSGAMAHLVEIGQGGEIKRWPWIELSLTPTPSNLLATVSAADIAKHFKAAELDIPDPVKAVLDAAAENALEDSDFAWIDSEGGRHLPMNDAAHARNAVARFDQTNFEDGAAEKKAWRRLMARCAKLGVEVSQDVMDAHKSFETKAAPESYEELIEMLGRLVNPFNPFGAPELYSHVEATFADHIIVERCQSGEKTYWRVPYSLDSSGKPQLGLAEEVEETYTPIVTKAHLPEISITSEADTVAHYAAALVERTKGLSERRTKEGRVLSLATRNRLTSCVETMNSAATELQALLDSTDPALAKALADFGRLSMDIDLLEFEAALTA